MGTLATSVNLMDRLGRDLTATEEARVLALLTDASATARKVSGQQFDLATTTARLTPRNGVVRLPQRPVLAVTAVTDTNANDVTFTWLGDDRVNIATQVFDSWSMVPYRNGITAVDVTYEHGYETVPDDIVAVVCQIVARALGRAPDSSGLTSETIEGYSYSLGSAAAAGPLGLLPDERLILESYRRVGSSSRFA